MTEKDETIAGYAGENSFALKEMLGEPVTARVTISFGEDGQVIGQAPCNRYFATQDAPLPWFSLGPIGATKMACPELEEEIQYFDLLGQATLAEVLGGILLLSNEDSVLLRFERVAE